MINIDKLKMEELIKLHPVRKKKEVKRINKGRGPKI